MIVYHKNHLKTAIFLMTSVWFLWNYIKNMRNIISDEAYWESDTLSGREGLSRCLRSRFFHRNNRMFCQSNGGTEEMEPEQRWATPCRCHQDVHLWPTGWKHPRVPVTGEGPRRVCCPRRTPRRGRLEFKMWIKRERGLSGVSGSAFEEVTAVCGWTGVDLIHRVMERVCVRARVFAS